MADIMTNDNGVTAAMLIAASNGGFGGHGHHGWHGNNDNNGFDGYRTKQNQANMSLMQSIGTVDKDVLAGTAAMEASQAAQSASFVSQLNNVTSSLVNRIDGVKDVVNSSAMVAAQQLAGVDKDIMESRYQVLLNVTADGDKTRALIQSQYTDTLNRQLAESNAALLASRHAANHDSSVTQIVNQAQAQSQTQNQFDRLYGLLNDASQSIRATNQAINFGAGTLTASPTNTSTNNRVS